MDIIKDYEARRDAARRQMDADLKAASEHALPESAGPLPVVGSGGVVGLRAATAKVSCARCEGTGFVWEGAGDCGPPNFCPTCGGDRIIEQRKPEPNTELRNAATKTNQHPTPNE